MNDLAVLTLKTLRQEWSKLADRYDRTSDLEVRSELYGRAVVLERELERRVTAERTA